MNPLGLIIIGLGIILIIIGFKGSQHGVIAAFKGVKSPTSSNPADTATASQSTKKKSGGTKK